GPMLYFRGNVNKEQMIAILQYCEAGRAIFHIIVRVHAVINQTGSANRRAAIKDNQSHSPVNRGVVVFEPVMATEKLSFAKVSDTQFKTFHMITNPEFHSDHFSDGTISVQFTISVVDRDRMGEASGVKTMFVDVFDIDA